jgi:hypothetical protein
MVLKEIYRAQREEVTEGCRKEHVDDLHTFTAHQVSLGL